MDPTEEAKVTSALRDIRHIHRALDSTNGLIAVSQQLSMARSAIALLDTTTLMDQPNRIRDQSMIITALQRLAYHNQDNGGIQDVAEWCVAQWLRILQHSYEIVEALQGVYFWRTHYEGYQAY
jgi:hypothetical protein